MKLSTKSRYGLRAMVDMAVNSTGEHMTLSDIAERQDVSTGYLEHIFSTLKKAGLVNSVKGAQGGYMLADSPSNITVGIVLRVLEGDLSIVDKDNEKVKYNDLHDFLYKNIWYKVNENINLTVDTITLEDMVNRYKIIRGNTGDMYYI